MERLKKAAGILDKLLLVLAIASLLFVVVSFSSDPITEQVTKSTYKIKLLACPPGSTDWCVKRERLWNY